MSRDHSGYVPTESGAPTPVSTRIAATSAPTSSSSMSGDLHLTLVAVLTVPARAYSSSVLALDCSLSAAASRN